MHNVPSQELRIFHKVYRNIYRNVAYHLSICNLYYIFHFDHMESTINGRILAQASNRDHIQVEERVTAAHRNTKLIIAQLLAYIGSFLLTLFLPLLRILLNWGDTNNWSETKSFIFINVLGKIMMVFMPLQGFFNFIIFLWHKGKKKLNVLCA